MISVRQKQILEGVVQEYIKKAQPVSSQLLEKKYRFGISPATIRNEMQVLTGEGYLFQPHTSAGRVPTDKGYRFFVDNLLEKGFKEFEIGDWFEKDFEDTIKFIQNLTKKLASLSRALVLSYLKREKIFWKEGWEEILREPEFKEKDCLINFTEFLKNFEENIEDYQIDSGIKVYIGKETLFKKAKDFSIISSKCCLPAKGEGIISLLGPKRMTYDRNISLINSLTKLLERF